MPRARTTLNSCSTLEEESLLISIMADKASDKAKPSDKAQSDSSQRKAKQAKSGKPSPKEAMATGASAPKLAATGGAGHIVYVLAGERSGRRGDVTVPPAAGPGEDDIVAESQSRSSSPREKGISEAIYAVHICQDPEQGTGWQSSLVVWR